LGYPPVPRIYKYLAQQHRLAPGGNAEIAIEQCYEGIILAWIGSIESGKGYGSAALAWLCRLADKHGVALFLKVDLNRVFTPVLRLINGKIEESALTPRGLELWYRRYGFRTLDRNDERVMLVRKAKK
jgi:hypothetical protein